MNHKDLSFIMEMMMEEDRYLKRIQEDISSLPNINLSGDTFKLDGGADTEKEWNYLISFLKSHYNKAKQATLNWLKGNNNVSDYNWKKVEGVKRLKGYKIVLEDRNGPYFQIEWEMLPYGMVKKANGKKVKIKYIVTEWQNGKYVVDIALPWGFHD